MGLSETHENRSSASTSQKKSAAICAKSSIRASVARNASATAPSSELRSALRLNCWPITPNSTAKPNAAPIPPAAIINAWLRHFVVRSSPASVLDDQWPCSERLSRHDAWRLPPGTQASDSPHRGQPPSHTTARWQPSEFPTCGSDQDIEPAPDHRDAIRVTVSPSGNSMAR